MLRLNTAMLHDPITHDSLCLALRMGEVTHQRDWAVGRVCGWPAGKEPPAEGSGIVAGSVEAAGHRMASTTWTHDVHTWKLLSMRAGLSSRPVKITCHTFHPHQSLIQLPYLRTAKFPGAHPHSNNLRSSGTESACVWCTLFGAFHYDTQVPDA